MIRRWGSFDDESPDDRELKISEVVSSQSKEELIDDLTVRSEDPKKRIRVQIKNPMVTQTVEALYQAELINKLLKKGTSRSDGNRLVTTTKKPLPKLIFPPEMTVDLLPKRRHCVPLNFIPPEKTDFTSGKPVFFPTISRDIQKTVLKKAICGHIKAVGFNGETTVLKNFHRYFYFMHFKNFQEV